MAKKKPQKKAGLQKRQQKKQQARQKMARARAKKQTSGPKQMTMGKLKKTLRQLPSLVFEPEIQEVAFSAEEVTAATKAHAETPDQVDFAANPAFMQRLGAQLAQLLIRFQKTGDSTKAMLVQTIQYFMERPDAPACMNQVIVGLFVQAQLQAEGVVVSLDVLQTKLKEYDIKYEELLQEKAKGLMEDAAPGQAPDLEEEGEEEEELEVSENQALLEELADFLEGKTEDTEIVADDAEVFLEDYLSEKQIALADLNGSKVKQFLTGWFVRNMNPTVEDMTQMLASLGFLFEFLNKTGRIKPEQATSVREILANQQEFLDLIE